MIWLVLSFVLAVVLLFHEGQKSLRSEGDFLFTKSSEFDLKKLFFAEGLKSILSSSVQSNLAAANLQSSIKIRGVRANTLRLAMSLLALIPLWLWSNLVFAVSGTYMAGFAAVIFLILSLFINEKVQILKGFVRFLFFAGVALVLMEQIMRLSGQVMMVAHEYEWIFVLSIGSLGNGLALLAFGFLMTFFLRFSGWSFVLSLVLLVTGILAFNNAVFLVAGEMLALPWSVFFFLRGFSPAVKKRYKHYTLVHSGAVIFTAFTLIFLRSEIFSANIGSLAQVEVRQQALLLVLAAYIIVPFAATMVWGHFANQSKAEEVDGTQVANLPSLMAFITSFADLRFLHQALEKRLETLTDQQQELKNQDYAAMPAQLLQKHSAELQTVQQILDAFKRFS